MNNKTNLIIKVVVLVLVLSSSAHATPQTVSLLGHDGIEVTNETGSVAKSVKTTVGTGFWAQLKKWKEMREANWPSKEEVVATLGKTNTLSRAGFIVYLRAVEEMNPNMGWQQIITKLHDESYPADSVCKVAGVPLFVNGKDNEGWEKVRLPNCQVPKFVNDSKGNKVDVAHAYAGIRGGLNRSGGTRWAMTNVNTGWGDSLQVASARIQATKSYVAGAFTFNYRKTDKAIDKFSNAGNFKPKDQVLGNNLGQEVQKTLRTSPLTLSCAFDLDMD